VSLEPFALPTAPEPVDWTRDGDSQSSAAYFTGRFVMENREGLIVDTAQTGV
jgi:hypothetical protein